MHISRRVFSTRRLLEANDRLKLEVKRLKEAADEKEKDAARFKVTKHAPNAPEYKQKSAFCFWTVVSCFPGRRQEAGRATRRGNVSGRLSALARARLASAPFCIRGRQKCGLAEARTKLLTLITAGVPGCEWNTLRAPATCARLCVSHSYLRCEYFIHARPSFFFFFFFPR